YGAGVGRADKVGKLLLERGDLRSLCDPTGEDDAAHGLGFTFVQDRSCDRNGTGGLGHHSAASGDEARSERHQSTSSSRPSSRLICALKPRICSAFPVSASLRVTPFTVRAAPCCGGILEPITLESFCASSSR